MKKLTSFLLLAVLSLTAQAKIHLPEIIGDNMVLQQQTSVNLWGSTDSKRSVVVTPSWSGGKTYEAKADKTLNSVRRDAKIAANQMLFDIEDKVSQNTQLALLASVLLFSGPFYLMFRHSPAIPDLRFSECFVAIVYITNMLLIFTIIPLKSSV